MKPVCEYVVAEGNGIAASEVYSTDVPPSWKAIEPLMFFDAGIMLRSESGARPVAPSVNVDEAVVYAVWEDPAATYPFQGKEVRPGVTCAMLIPSSDPDGPPWLPIQAVVGSSQAEIESGILSPWLDQVACARFKPELTVSKGRLNVATTPSTPVTADSSALRDTLVWLATHTEDTGLFARVARTMLVESGHGIQRYGVSLMSASDADKTAAIETVLKPLFPDVAAIVAPLWETWISPRALRQSGGQPASLLSLANALERNLSEKSAMQSPAALGTLVTWLSGLFGVRAERTGRQPARTLYAVVRAIRTAGRQMKAMKHVDSPLPRLPLDRAENRDLVRELSATPQNETSFERLLRAMAIAESGWYLARPRRDHLRPFRQAYTEIRGFPNASRSLVGRFDYVFSAWSFRGAELRDDGVPERALAGVFITNSPSITSTRAFARVVATPGPTGGFVSDGLKSLDHPTLTQIGQLRDMEDAEVVALYDESVSHDRTTYLRVQVGIGAAEYLITRSEQGDAVDGFALLAPVRPGEAAGGVRGHFMYWRMFCRSIAWKLPDVYQAFIEDVGAHMDALPPKLQTEVFALARRWGMHSDEHRAHAAGWSSWLTAAADAYFAAEDRTWLDGEWIEALAGAMAVSDRDATVAFLEKLATDDRFPIGQFDRILDGVRSAGWARELVAAPVFTTLHTRLCSETTVQGLRARVQWTREAVDLAEKTESVRWLLDVRAYPRVLGSAEFDAWFSEHGKSAVTDPNAAVVALLGVAIQHITSDHLDMALRALRSRGDEAAIAAALASRPEALVQQLRAVPAADAATHASAVAALFGASSGAELRDAGVALAHFVSVHGDGEMTEVLRDGYAGAFANYKPYRYTLDGFAAALEGWVLAGAGLREPAAALAEEAARWGLEANDDRLLGFVGAVADAAGCAEMRGPVLSAVQGDGSALGVALMGLTLPSTLDGAVQIAKDAGKKKGSVRKLRAQLVGSGAADALDALVAAAVGAVLADGGDPETLATQLTSLARAGGVVEEAPAVDDSASAVDETAAVEDDAAADGAEAAATAEPEEQPSADADGAALDPAQAKSATAKPARAAVGPDERRREEFGKALGSAFQRWSAAARRLAGSSAASAALLAVAGRYNPAFYRLRGELFAQLSSTPESPLKDGRRLLTTDFMDGETLWADAADFAAIVEALRATAALHGTDGSATVERRSVAVPLPRPPKAEPKKKAPEAVAEDVESETVASADAPAPEAEPTTDDVVSEEVSDAEAVVDDAPAEASSQSGDDGLEDDESAAPTASTDADSDESDDSDADDSDADDSDADDSDADDSDDSDDSDASNDAEKAVNVSTLLRNAYGVDADAEQRAAAFGDPGVPVLLRHLAKRNGWTIKFGKDRKQVSAQLQWGGRHR